MAKLTMVTVNAAFEELKAQVAEHERQTALRLANLELANESLNELVAAQGVVLEGLIDDVEKLNKFRDSMRNQIQQAQAAKNTPSEPPFKPTKPAQAQQPALKQPAKPARLFRRNPQAAQQTAKPAVTSLEQYAEYKTRMIAKSQQTRQSVIVIPYAKAQHMSLAELMKTTE